MRAGAISQRLAAASRNPLLLSVVLTLGMAATVGVALGFQHIGGYVPCKLCLEQREPYYFAIPLAAIGAILIWRSGPLALARGLLAVVGLAMLYNVALAVYHSGVEWTWWPGPTDCGAASDGVLKDAGDLFSGLASQTAPACDQAAGRFLGLSFAGWNVIAAGSMAAIAIRAALMRRGA
jgi:disulfide bond formation protein DsbB